MSLHKEQKAVLSSLLAIVIILAAFSLYENQVINSSNDVMGSLRQTVSSLSNEIGSMQKSIANLSKQGNLSGFVHARTVVTGLQIPSAFGYPTPGARYRIVSFLADESGLISVQVVSTMSGNVTIGDGATMSRPFPVVSNGTMVNDALLPIVPGNVTVYFVWAGFDPSVAFIAPPANVGDTASAFSLTQAAVITPLVSANFTVTYYYWS